MGDDVVKELLAKGVNINSKHKVSTKRGYEMDFTPLQGAALNGQKKVVEFLLSKGAKVSLKNDYGYTAVHWATREGHQDIITLFLKNGVSVDMKNADGHPPIHTAARYGHLEIVKLLFKNGSNINYIPNKNGELGLMEPCQKPYTLFVIPHFFAGKKICRQIQSKGSL